MKYVQINNLNKDSNLTTNDRRIRMQNKYKLAFTILFAFLISGLGMQVKAQDTLVVPWETTVGSGLPLTNALYNAIQADTNVGGTRKNLNRVYKLKAGGLYQNTEPIINNGFALRIVGETPNPNDAINGSPAEILMFARGDGSVSGKILQGYGDVYLKNLYIIGSDNNGVQTYYQPMEFDGDNLRCTFDNVIFERTNFAIMAYTGKNNKIYLTNCKFLNMVEKPVTQQWTGRGISVWADVDTVIVENCTFDNIGFTVLQIEGGAANYVRFVHNTLVNVGRSINTGSWYKEAYFADNLYVNCFFDGEGWGDYSLAASPSRDPRAYTTGMFALGTLPSTYGPNLGRRILFSNSAAYLATSFRKAWADTIRIQPYTNAVSDSFFTTFSPANGGQMVIKDTAWLSAVPKFTNYDTTNYSTMIAFIQDVRAGILPTPNWMQNLVISSGDTIWSAPQWPIVQNFAYTDANLLTAGHDGLPLGDLNWFPAKLTDWNNNKSTYLTSLHNLPGPKKIETVDTTIEAETGAVSGTAAVTAVAGRTFYDYTGSGSIIWTFTAPSAGQYDTRWLVNETGRGQSGPDLAINGTQFVDKAHGWGQFVFDPLLGPAIGQSNSAWIWVPITADSVLASQASLFTLAAGKNTIGVVGGGWGEVKFSEIDVVKHGTTDTIKLKAPDAVTSLVTPGAEGVKWVASGFKYVNMGATGTADYNVNVASDGTYRVSLTYQNTTGATTGTVKVDGQTVLTNVPLALQADGTSAVELTNTFSLTKGTHKITVSSGNINLDYVQLVHETLTGLKIKNNNVPNSYSLSQNYPNPFNPTTTINFQLAKASNVKLTVYNIAGQRVASLINNTFMNAGSYAYQFDAKRLASGIYFYQLQAGGFVANKKMILLK